ncbi:type II toxin-antitoxin system prevent-host-death family antitoxin [Streptomyces hygroscopicus]|uniref:type II toxin-antitoxin system prevent-host-death family antitoxin n=1 Tax=Streptomyces hygroscopicus TaxID=1912 RepID=UPI00381EDAEB
MASDLEPRIAEDGVQEVPLTKARALLTRVIEQAREDDLVSTFTVRGRRRAYLVAPKIYERAQADRALAVACLRLIDELPEEKKREAWVRNLIRLRNELVHGP